jgi:hypothetical protein
MVIVKDIIRTYYSCDENIQLDIDAAISKLSKDGTLSDVELVVLAVTREQYSLTLAGELVGISKSSVGRALDTACEKIASCLGSGYQDSLIIEAVEKRLGRKLTPDEDDFCWKKINDFGRNQYAKMNLFNFEIKDGKIVGIGEDQTAG